MLLPAPLAVLLVHAADWAYFTDIKTTLEAPPANLTVQTFNADYSEGGTPSLTQLQAYAAVLVMNEPTGWRAPWADPTALGDNLGAYHDGGGRVVLTMYACGGSERVQGRWATDNYDLIIPGGTAQAEETAPLEIMEPDSPLVVGVTSLTAEVGYRCTGALAAGSTVVAKWGSGAPLIVRGMKNGQTMVTLNFFAASRQVRGEPYLWNITGSGAAIMRNALLF